MKSRSLTYCSVHSSFLVFTNLLVIARHGYIAINTISRSRFQSDKLNIRQTRKQDISNLNYVKCHGSFRQFAMHFPLQNCMKPYHLVSRS